MTYQLKGLLKKAAYRTVSSEPILSVYRKSRLHNKAVVLMYHELARDTDDIEAWTVVKETEFVRQMEYLLRYFSVVSLEEALSIMSHSHDLGRPLAVVTFDDGYAGNRKVLLPIVKSMNIPVTIFVSTRAVQDQTLYWFDRLISALQWGEVINISLAHLSLGNYRINHSKGMENWRVIERLLSDLKTVSPDIREEAVRSIIADMQLHRAELSYHLAPLAMHEIRELADCPLVCIGAHSHCHNLLTQLPDDDVRTSVRTSKELLEAWISHKVEYFSYPNGNYSDRLADILKEEGFVCSLTTTPHPWAIDESMFTIPRIGVGRYDSLDNFKTKVSGISI